MIWFSWQAQDKTTNRKVGIFLKKVLEFFFQNIFNFMILCFAWCPPSKPNRKVDDPLCLPMKTDCCRLKSYARQQNRIVKLTISCACQ
jgi:hypothetical protein